MIHVQNKYIFSNKIKSFKKIIIIYYSYLILQHTINTMGYGPDTLSLRPYAPCNWNYIYSQGNFQTHS